MARKALAKAILSGIALFVTGCATADDGRDVVFGSEENVPAADRARASWTSQELVTFEDEREFRRYLSDVWRAGRARGEWWAMLSSDRRGGGGEQTLTVTGSRIPPRNASITNVQEAGVDEGDIVKQIGQFLLVLQDGRLFAVDTQAGDGRDLALTDRINVYRDVAAERGGGTWYDEMLVHGDRIVVTGYSYREAASELSVFRLQPDGRLVREGTFFISSNDYYSTSNYATRLVRGNLVIYTPLRLTEGRPGRRQLWPVVRRWRPAGEDRGRGRPLFDASQIYRPLLDSREPAIHTISVCPLAAEAAGVDLECRSTAFVGPASGLIYYSPQDAYLWLIPTYEDEEHLVDETRCSAGRPALDDVVRTLIYRIPLTGEGPLVLAVRGAAPDHFAVQVREDELRALVRSPSMRCSDEQERPGFFTYLRVPLGAFGPALREPHADSYRPLPGISFDYTHRTAHRFTDTHLIYAPLGRSHFFREEDRPRPSEAIVVPVQRPGEARRLSVPHNIIRAEQAGNDIVFTGYADEKGLSVSFVDVDGFRIASTHRFAGRRESEGRSHAFNSLIAGDGSGFMGLPTVPRQDGEERVSWRSRASDVSFLAVDGGGRLRPLGHLVRGIDYDDGDQDGVAGYECEVSCVDWYGNSRPIFTDGRIFALAGAELIEGRVEDGRIREVQRLNIALEHPPR
jgi:hypothetical protein